MGRSPLHCDDAEVHHVVSVLDREDALDLKEQQAAWRSDGGQEHDAAELVDRHSGSSGSAQAGTEAGYDLTAASDMTRISIERAPTDEPDEVGQGRVRIQSHKVKRPVEG